MSADVSGVVPIAAMTSIAPQFLVADLRRSIAYYRDCLGFRQRIDYGDFYASVVRESAEIHLKCAPALPGARTHQRAGEHLDAFVEVTGLDALHAAFEAAGARIVQPPTTHPWGARDCIVEDPDRYRLAFSESVRSADDGVAVSVALELRMATARDRAAVERVWRAQNAHHVPLEPERMQIVSDPLPEDVWARVLADPDQDFLLVERDGAAIAAALLELRLYDGGVVRRRRVAFVTEICVLPAHRGLGIGRRMMAAIRAWAQARSAESIELNVWTRNEGARRFYRSLGFRSLREELTLELAAPNGPGAA